MAWVEQQIYIAQPERDPFINWVENVYPNYVQDGLTGHNAIS